MRLATIRLGEKEKAGIVTGRGLTGRKKCMTCSAPGKFQN